MHGVLNALAYHLWHELRFSDLGAVALTLISVLLYTHFILCWLMSAAAPATTTTGLTIAALELFWQFYSRFVLLGWLDEHHLPVPSHSEWKKGAAYLLEVFSSDFRAMWEHLCHDSLSSISRETALDVLHCLVSLPEGSTDVAMLDSLLEQIERAHAPFKFHLIGKPPAHHRMTGNRDSIAPFSRHLPLLIVGVCGSIIEFLNIAWLLWNGWHRHVCSDVPVSYWTRGPQNKKSVNVFCPGFGNLVFNNMLISQRLLRANPNQEVILMDLRWYSLHACAPRQPNWGKVADAVSAILETPRSKGSEISLVSHSGGTILANQIVGRGGKFHSVLLMDPAIFNPPWTGSSVNSFSFPATWACGCCRSGVVWEDTPFADAYRNGCEKVTVLFSEKDLLVPPRTGLHFVSKLHAQIGSRLQVIIDRGANHGSACLEPSRPAVAAAFAGRGNDWSDVRHALETRALPINISGQRLLWELGVDGFSCIWRSVWRIWPVLWKDTKLCSVTHIRNIFPM